MKDTVIYAPNAVEAVMIFSGSIADGSLKPVPLSVLEWHNELDRDEDFSYLTLDEIYRQLSEKTDEMITVVVERPLNGVIYQCGNCGDGIWVQHGTTRGYA
ncbi:MAG: hypothetical protein K2F73_07595 [Ruminococcus sp.]|nr:hypothetical protein [Ruminococcus sp.]